MDLKAYFKKIRDVEASIPTPYVVIVGLETPDGGKEGTFTEVSKKLAARMIAESRGRLASEAEAEAFLESRTEARRAAEALAAAQRMQFTLVQPVDPRTKPVRGPKE
jgi:hypothetical protein